VSNDNKMILLYDKFIALKQCFFTLYYIPSFTNHHDHKNFFAPNPHDIDHISNHVALRPRWRARHRSWARHRRTSARQRRYFSSDL